MASQSRNKNNDRTGFVLRTWHLSNEQANRFLSTSGLDADDALEVDDDEDEEDDCYDDDDD